jgi:hypothetical protein
MRDFPLVAARIEFDRRLTKGYEIPTRCQRWCEVARSHVEAASFALIRK